MGSWRYCYTAKERLSASFPGRFTAWAVTAEGLAFEPVWKLWRKVSLSSPGIEPPLAGRYIELCAMFSPLNAKSNPICHFMALLGAHSILHVSRIRVKLYGKADVPSVIWIFKQNRWCTYIVILWRVRVTIVAIGKQQWVNSVLSS
jgi:hypothetical protein